MTITTQTVKNYAWNVFVILQDPKDFSMLPVSLCTIQESEKAALIALLATPSVLKLISDGYKMISNQCHLIPPHIAPMNREDNPNKIEIKPATPEDGGMPIP